MHCDVKRASVLRPCLRVCGQRARDYRYDDEATGYKPLPAENFHNSPSLDSSQLQPRCRPSPPSTTLSLPRRSPRPHSPELGRDRETHTRESSSLLDVLNSLPTPATLRRMKSAHSPDRRPSPS